MYAELRVNLQQKVYVVWHDFHFDYIDLDFFADWLDQLLQSGVNAIDQDFSAVFGAEHNMVFAWIYYIVTRVVFDFSHIRIILLQGN